MGAWLFSSLSSSASPEVARVESAEKLFLAEKLEQLQRLCRQQGDRIVTLEEQNSMLQRLHKNLRADTTWWAAEQDDKQWLCLFDHQDVCSVE